MAASQTIRTLKLSLLADVSEFGKGLDKAGSNFRKFSKGVEQASKFANVAIGAVGALGVSAINAASDLDETSSAIEQVFGRRSAAQLQRFAQTAAQSLGQSRQQALSAAQSFGIFGTSAGLADDDLVEFTTSLVTLAADLASFNNTDVDTAINALGAALRGESEPIRQYGVLLDAATLKNRALAEGIIETTEEALTPQQRTMAAYAEILAQTSLQQGDFARTSDGLANSQRILKAELENFRVEVGEELLPVVQQLLPEIRGLVDTFTSTDPETIVNIGKAILGLAAAIKVLNASLKAFAAVKSAFLLVTGAVAGGGAGAAAVGGGIVLGGALATNELSQALTDEQRSNLGGALSGGRTTRTPPPNFGGTAGQRQTGNVQVNVSGVVGSSYQAAREIDRFLAIAERSRTGVPSNAR